MVLCITKFVSWAFVSLRFRVGSLGNVFSQEPDCGAGFGLWLLVVEAGGYVRRRGVVGLLWKLDLKNTAAGFGQLCVCRGMLCVCVCVYERGGERESVVCVCVTVK